MSELIADFSWGEPHFEGSIVLGNGIIKANKIIEEYINVTTTPVPTTTTTVAPEPLEADFSWGEIYYAPSPSPEPYADFDYVTDDVFMDVQLYNRSVGDTSYRIEWGDDAVTEGSGTWTYFVHDYAAPGEYPITLIINGGISSMTQTIIINVVVTPPPVTTPPPIPE